MVPVRQPRHRQRGHVRRRRLAGAEAGKVAGADHQADDGAAGADEVPVLRRPAVAISRPKPSPKGLSGPLSSTTGRRMGRAPMATAATGTVVALRGPGLDYELVILAFGCARSGFSH